MSEKIYVGKGKESQYGVRIDICLDAIYDYAKEKIEKATNGKKYIKLNVNPMRQQDDRGNTHSVSIDTWKPEKKAEKPADAAESDTPF